MVRSLVLPCPNLPSLLAFEATEVDVIVLSIFGISAALMVEALSFEATLLSRSFLSDGDDDAMENFFDTD